ncbi:MAG TPA: BatA domain-containing protein, partial [Tepidisphaeraceae bacterium]|nr:BatA domain-containing protein [Tepidisphaeraceae bacterium]
MNLLNPWAALAGVAAIGLPVLIHFLTRPRPVKTPLSTIRFVREVVLQKRRRNRLRDLLVLLLRTAAVALLALAFARPMLASRPGIDPRASASVVRVVLLDDSLSMAEVDGASSAFERARTEAVRFLPAESGLQADLVVAAARPHPVFDRVTRNIAALRDT